MGDAEIQDGLGRTDGPEGRQEKERHGEVRGPGHWGRGHSYGQGCGWGEAESKIEPLSDPLT